MRLSSVHAVGGRRPAASFDDFIEHMQDAAESVGREAGHAPDYQWMPVMTIDAGGALYVMPLRDMMVSADQWKQEATEVLPKLLVEREARFYAVLASMWAVVGRADLDEQGINEHPDKVEALALHVARPLHGREYVAEIERHDDAPPTLKPWQNAEAAMGTDAMDLALSLRTRR